MGQRLIYLDRDGVITLELERPGVDGATAYKFSDVSRDAIERLNRICDVTGAVVVVSASRRTNRPLNVLQLELYEAGLRHHVVGKTPAFVEYGKEQLRGMEILADLLSRWPVESYVVLDDGAGGLMRLKELHPRIVKTTSVGGLEDEHVERAVELLNTPIDWRKGVAG